MIDLQREVGRVVGTAPGATLVVVAGIHGNEPAGVEAAKRVLARIDASTIKGELVVLAGNVAGLRAGVRYFDRDLNRSWTEPQIKALLTSSPSALGAEDREQLELLGHIEAAQKRARGTVHLADLHTSSAQGVPFVLFRDTPQQRAFVSTFPIPVISGIVEKVEGVLSELVGARGFVSFSVEGGQHDDPASRDSLEGIIWLCLSQAQMVIGEPMEIERSRKLLTSACAGLPRVVEVVSRHAITVDDAFVMERGFRNIDRIEKGQLLARDKRGEVRATESGVVVLPLYQKLGNDGFFWGREV